MNRLIALVAVSILLGACAGDPPLEGIDLPVAETPASVAENLWALPFVAELPAGYWSAGQHRYRFVIDCPALGDPVESNAIEFMATPLIPTLQGPVYIRLSGLSDGIITPANVPSINPDQETIAAVTFMGLSLDTIDQAVACEGTMEFDGGQAEAMRPGEPFRP